MEKFIFERTITDEEIKKDNEYINFKGNDGKHYGNNFPNKKYIIITNSKDFAERTKHNDSQMSLKGNGWFERNNIKAGTTIKITFDPSEIGEKGLPIIHIDISNNEQGIIQKTDLEEILRLLESNENLILTGAPGTGKTFLAKQIAEELVGKDKKDNIGFVQFHPSYDYTDFVEGLRPKKGNDDKEMGFELKNGIFKEFCKKAKDKEDEKEKFVFIIDEINRGEISKIFGELFFCIDQCYRGVEGKVQTQYANIQTEETIFCNEIGSGWFYIPKNVYIIGTMNDIDRSVESFDFAMRRRFTWKEITAKESQAMFENEEWAEEAERRMDNLNTEIENISELNSSYHIGGAYFKTNLPKYDNEKRWDNLWDLYIKPLLMEYLRGVPDSEKKLKELKAAYDKIDLKNSKNGSNQDSGQ